MAGGALGAAYKAVWYVDEAGVAYPTIKTAGAKSTWPGKKEVYRHPDWAEDVIQLAQETPPAHYQRLLRPVMRQGQILPGSLPPLSEIRELAQAQLQRVPAPYRTLEAVQPYPVRFSEELQTLRTRAAQAGGEMLLWSEHEG